MKWVYPSLEEVSRDLVTYIDKHQGTTSFKAKELCMRFTLNSVGACAFGLDAKCFEEDNPEFKQIGDRFLVPEGFQAVKAFLIRMIPVLRKMVSFR